MAKINDKEALGGLLARWMTRNAGPGQLAGLARLSGGANMESWSYEWADAPYILRRAPSAAFMEGRAYGHETEAALIKAVAQSGAKVPEVVGILGHGDGLGSGYIMRRVIAEVHPDNIVSAPPSGLVGAIGRELARIHAVPRSAIPANVPQISARQSLAELKSRFFAYGGDRPIIALAIKWCEDNLPEANEAVLVHGDYRMGNIMVDDKGVAAVLDWELAHIGDGHEDLAFGCMTVWCFGKLDHPAFGVGSLEDLFHAYEIESGHAVDRRRFRYWLVHRTLWWSLGCLEMAERWRSGADKSVERVVIGRRAAEQELDLLRLLEDDAPQIERRRVMPAEPIACPVAVGEPSKREIVEAVRVWLTTAIKPATHGHDKFQVAVAINALGILERELGTPSNAADKGLSEAILSGERTLHEPFLLARLRRAILAKCCVDSPKYPALAVAASQWAAATD